MIYVKSILAGILAVLIPAILFTGGILVYSAISFHGYPWDFYIRVNHVSLWGLPIMFLIFSCGFAWEFRRASRSTHF